MPLDHIEGQTDFIPLEDAGKIYVPHLIKGRVILVSTKDELQVGRIKGFSLHQNSGSKLPIVTVNDGKEDKDLLCFCLLIPYTAVMYDMLEKLDPVDRVEVVRDILHFNADLLRLERPDILKGVE